MTKKTMLTLTTLAVVAIAAVAVPVLAKPGDGSGPGPASDHRGPGGNATDRREARQDARESRHEAMRDAHDQWQECKRDYRENHSLNDSMQERCMADKDFFLNATQARREAHADIGAILGLERRLGRLEERKILLQHEMDSNASLNDTQKAELQHRIDKIQDHEEKLVVELQKLRSHLKDLDGKWTSVREHIAERRHKGLDDGLEDSDAEDSGASDSGSASASSSDSDSDSGSA